MGAADMQDAATANVVQYADIEALRLKLEEEVLSMTFLEKIFLIMHGMGVEVNDENTVIKENEVLKVLDKALMPYQELFFGKAFDNDYMYHYPVMVYDESDPSRYYYYWYVTMSLDASYNDYITVILDDETGKLLAIDMTDPKFNIDESYLQELQYALSTIYFSELDISPVAEWPIEAVAANEKDAMGITTVAANYQFIDILYGEVNVEIGVRVDGFYIYFT